jgi:hypothetical protein
MHRSPKITGSNKNILYGCYLLEITALDFNIVLDLIKYKNLEKLCIFKILRIYKPKMFVFSFLHGYIIKFKMTKQNK